MDHLREAESLAAEPAVKVADGMPPPTAEFPVLPTHYCTEMIYYFGSLTFVLWMVNGHWLINLRKFLIRNWEFVKLCTKQL